MKRRLILLAVGLLLTIALAGCGGSSGQSAGGMMNGGGGMMQSGSTGTPTTIATTSGGGADAAGRTLFVAQCGSCHTLAAAGTHGTAGPSLDQTHPSYDEIVEIATKGGSVMPAFASRLSQSQIEAIARYVSGATG